jgi:hypothetical protein
VEARHAIITKIAKCENRKIRHELQLALFIILLVIAGGVVRGAVGFGQSFSTFESPQTAILTQFP